MTDQSKPPPVSSVARKAPSPHSTPSPQDRRAARNKVARFQRWLHFRFPNIAAFQAPDTKAHVLEKDSMQNAASRVPDEEDLRQLAIWGVELFGPAEIETLYRSFRQLKWDNERLFGACARPVAWITQQRMYGSEGSLNLGIIDRHGKRRFLLDTLHAPLPDSVDYARGYVYQVTPSLTAVLLCFVLTDAASHAYRLALAPDRATKNIRRQGTGGYRVLDVAYQKRFAVENVRAESRQMIARWFATYLPGLFSSRPGQGTLPTAELIATSKEALPTNRETGYLKEDWACLMTDYGHRDVWTHQDVPGLSLFWEDRDDRSRYHCLVNLRVDLVDEHALGTNGDRSADTYTALVGDHIDGVLINLAVNAILREMIRTLRLTRDTLRSPRGRTELQRTLSHIRGFFDQTNGLPTIAAELLTRAGTDRSYRWQCGNLVANLLHPEDKPREIAETLRSWAQFLSTSAVAQDKETRDHLEQLASILSTQENVRTQRRMEAVTFVATILAAASLIVALMSIERFANAVNGQVEKLFGDK